MVGSEAALLMLATVIGNKDKTIQFEKLKNILKGLFIVFGILVISYQFDMTKRFIASYNHKRQLPVYISNIKLSGMAGITILGESRTHGKLPKDSILNFYNDIHGLVVGGIDSFKQKLDTNFFSIAYISSIGKYNTINFSNQKDRPYYLVEIITNDDE